MVNYKIMFIVVIFFIAIAIIATFLVNSQRMKTHFENLGQRKLIEVNIRARDVRKRLLYLQYAILVLLLVTVALTRLWMLLYPALILFLFLFVLRGIYASLDVLTATEIEYRKDKKIKQKVRARR
jgi:phosphatidylglycerophosphate synthase